MDTNLPQSIFADIKPKTSDKNKLLAGALDVGSAIANIGSAFAEFSSAKILERNLRVQSIFNDLSIREEKLRGKQISNILRENFLKNISSTRATFGARGVSIGSGIGRQFTIQNLADLDRELKIIELDSQSAISSLKLKESQIGVSRKFARGIGILRTSIPAVKGTSQALTGFKTILQNRRGK